MPTITTAHPGSILTTSTSSADFYCSPVLCNRCDGRARHFIRKYSNSEDMSWGNVRWCDNCLMEYITELKRHARQVVSIADARDCSSLFDDDEPVGDNDPFRMEYQRILDYIEDILSRAGSLGYGESKVVGNWQFQSIDKPFVV